MKEFPTLEFDQIIVMLNEYYKSYETLHDKIKELVLVANNKTDLELINKLDNIMTRQFCNIMDIKKEINEVQDLVGMRALFG